MAKVSVILNEVQTQLGDRLKSELQAGAIQQLHDRLELVFDDDGAVGGGDSSFVTVVTSLRFSIQIFAQSRCSCV